MFQTGDQIGSFTLVDKLGRGAFGEVWLAEEKTAISLHRVALKLPNEAEIDLDAIRQEADVWENVKGHPNILPIIRADIYEGQIYIASEYAPDGSLNEWLKTHGGKAPSVEIAVKMTRGILAGLEHLHSKGVIHRDLKPANILLQSLTPRIADFGIARLTKADVNSTVSAGTPSYMAPECFYSVRSEQTDIWAVGVLFHKLLSGKLPFSHPDQVSVMNAILNAEPDIAPDIPENLKQIIRKALQKETEQRYQSAAEMRAALNAVVLEIPAIENAAAANASIAPTPAPIKIQIEREEETIVRPASIHPAEPPPVVHVQRIVDKSPSRTGLLAIVLSSLLVLAAVTVWAALKFGGGEPATQTNFSNSPIESNINSALPNTKSGALNPGNFAVTRDEKRPLPSLPGSSGAGVPASSGETNSNSAAQNENPSATPFTIQSDDAIPNSEGGGRTRTPKPETTPAEDAPPPVKKAPTPIPVTPDSTSSPAGRQRARPTPKPTEKPEETPPPMEKNDSDVN